MMFRSKNFLSIFMIVILLLATVSCQNETNEFAGTETVQQTQKESETPGMPNNEEITQHPPMQESPVEFKLNTYKLNDTSGFVKLLDERMQATSTGIYCDYTCAGIEFVATCEGDITFKIQTTGNCNFKAFVDGEHWKNGDSDYYAISSDSQEATLKDIEKGTHSIRLIKVTNIIHGKSTLLTLTLTGEVSQTAPEKKELFIEFLGDSITSGWGLVGNKNGSWETHDGSLAYPYLLTEQLDADYSIVSWSGRSLVGGAGPALEDAYKINTRDGTTEYDFSRKSDIVVINVGTNDRYLNISTTDFADAYERLVKYVREKNGEDCIVLAIYNTMNDNYSKEIKALMEKMGGVDNNLYAVKFNSTVSGHPTQSENIGYTDVLYDLIEDILFWM